MLVGFLPGRRSGRYTSERSLRGERERRVVSEEVGHGRFEHEGAATCAAALAAGLSSPSLRRRRGRPFPRISRRRGFATARRRMTTTAPWRPSTSLRIAAFGFLERPALLCESLIYLAVADEAAERHGDAQATVDRLLELQRTVPACAEAKVSPAVRSTFETRFRQLLPGSVPPAAPPKVTPSPRPPPPAPTSTTGRIGEPVQRCGFPRGEAPKHGCAFREQPSWSVFCSIASPALRLGMTSARCASRRDERRSPGNATRRPSRISGSPAFRCSTALRACSSVSPASRSCRRPQAGRPRSERRPSRGSSPWRGDSEPTEKSISIRRPARPSRRCCAVKSRVRSSSRSRSSGRC